MARKLLRFLDGLITGLVVLALVISGAYAGYALWDNQQVYDTAESVYSEMREIRASLPDASSSSMEQLLEEYRKARKESAEKKEESGADIPTETKEGIQAASKSEAEQAVDPAVEVQAADEPEQVVIDVAQQNAVPAETFQVEMVSETNVPVEEPTAEPLEMIRAELAVEQSRIVERGIDPSPETTDVIHTEVIAGSQQSAESSAENVTKDTETKQTAGVAQTEKAAAASTKEPEELTVFEQLQAINPDVTGWITMPGTAIDYPVLQGATNYSYINTDIYGNFVMTGSIFLDSRNNRDYTDVYSLLYGHNMSQHRMFSDVNLYKEEDFFRENELGLLLLPEGTHVLESLAIIVITASDSGMFNPENWESLDGEGILKEVTKNALYTNENGLESLRAVIDRGEMPRIVSLSTCSDEFTDARTILLTLMDPEIPAV